jgi:LmbE family N-acetylglucosaminyl deacetylase
MKPLIHLPLLVVLLVMSVGARADGPQFPAIRIPERLMVLAPHPDDILNASGLAQRVLSRGGQVRVVDMTCGDGDSPIARAYIHRQGFVVSPNPFLNYAYFRQLEDQAAAQILGYGPQNLFFLGYPDGGMWEILQRGLKNDPRPVKGRHSGMTAVPYSNAVSPGSPYTAENVIRDLSGLMGNYRPDMVVMPHPNDNHLDHAATWYFGNQAIDAAGLDRRTTSVHTVFDIYAGDLPVKLNRKNWQRPTRKTASKTTWSELLLTPGEMEGKIQAIKQYRSQTIWEHPFLKEYDGTDSYLFGYVTQNELFGTVTDVKHDEKARQALERKAMLQRGIGLVGNVVEDYFRRFRRQPKKPAEQPSEAEDTGELDDAEDSSSPLDSWN